jgi:hypothetical protein
VHASRSRIESDWRRFYTRGIGKHHTIRMIAIHMQMSNPTKENGCGIRNSGAHALPGGDRIDGYR